jgi:hypothetical protein
MQNCEFTLTVSGGGMKKQKEVVNINTSSCRSSWLTVKGVESWGKKRQSGKATNEDFDEGTMTTTSSRISSIVALTERYAFSGGIGL